MKNRRTGKCLWNQSVDWFNPKKANVRIIDDEKYKDAFGLMVPYAWEGEVPKSMNLKKGERVSFALGRRGGRILGSTVAKAIKRI